MVDWPGFSSQFDPNGWTIYSVRFRRSQEEVAWETNHLPIPFHIGDHPLKRSSKQMSERPATAALCRSARISLRLCTLVWLTQQSLFCFDDGVNPDELSTIH
jgi:hypothetical protein